MKSTIGKPIRVVIIDDERLLAKALGAWLARDSGLKVEGYAESGNRGWELCQATHPDLALVDVEMSDGDGIALAQRLLDKFPETRVIIMTGRVDPHTAWQAGQTGVHGLIDKTIEPEVLGQVIQLVVEGGRVLSQSFQKIREEWLTEPEAFQKVLTNRELAVLLRVTDGQSDRTIGIDLGISEATVACHRKSIRKKLSVHDDRSLVAYGRQWGIFGVSAQHQV
jgi:DNA-binding NarL/FixJ family response regulator